MTTFATAADTVAEVRPRRPVTRRSARAAVRSYPLATAATTYLVQLVAAAAAATLVAPTDPEHQDLAHVLATPSHAHWLGTDRLGRDILSRLLFGARVTLLDVAVAVAVFLAIGVPLGIAAGYRDGWLDRIVVRFADLLLAVPGIVVLLMVVAIFPGNDIATMVALGVIGCPGLLRIVRGATMSIRGELYVQAARLSGLRTVAILRRHVLPRIAGPIIVQTSLFCATALLAESGLSFLGLTRPETQGPSWGNMVAEASNAMSQDPWMLVPTGAALMLTVAALGFVGDIVRDATMGRSVTAVPLLQRGGVREHARPAAGRRSVGAEVLAVRGLTVTLGGATVVRDVSFDINAGEAVGISANPAAGRP